MINHQLEISAYSMVFCNFKFYSILSISMYKLMRPIIKAKHSKVCFRPLHFCWAYLGILTPKWSFVLFNKSKGQRCVVIDSKIKKLVWVISRLLFRLKMKVFFMNKPYVRHKPFFQVDLFYEYQINCACACVVCFVWWKITSRLIGWLWSLSKERLLFLKESQTWLIFFHF